jgi:hypothetical protein
MRCRTGVRHWALAAILEQCSLLLPLLWGAGPMALMLWLDGMMMMMALAANDWM